MKPNKKITSIVRISLLIFGLSFPVFNQNVYGQDYCNTLRFDTTDIFLESELDSTILQFGQNTDWLGNPTNLFTFLVYPDTTLDTFTKRPMIMLIHGGGLCFGNRNECKQEAIYYAKKGFVVASIDYRIGWYLGAGNYPTYCNGTNVTHIQALYRAVQDTKAALRFFVAISQTYRIDENFIFIGGSSAGAFASLATAFISQNDFESIQPSIGSVLGSLDSASNGLTDSYSIKGILSSKGGLFDTIVMSGGNSVPVILFHGTADTYYPYLEDHAYSCSNYFTMQGSGFIAPKLEHLGECYELNIRNGVGHELPAGEYMYDRKLLFVKRILCNDCRQIIVIDSTVFYDSGTITAVQAANGISGLSITVYPNPVTDFLQLESNFESPLRFEAFDNLGRLSLQGEIGNDKTIDMRTLNTGLYFLRITNGPFVFTQKIIKQ